MKLDVKLNQHYHTVVVEDYEVENDEIVLTSAYFEDTNLELAPRELAIVGKQKQSLLKKVFLAYDYNFHYQ